MKKIKKFTALFLAALMLFVSLTPFSALASGEKLTMGEKPDDVLIWFAEEFAKKFDESLSLEADFSVPVCDLNEEITGYMISYVQDGVPYGYIILDVCQEGLASEFVIHEKAADMYSNLIADASGSEKFGTPTGRMFKISPYDYMIEYNSPDGELFYFSNITREYDAEMFEVLVES